MRTEHHVELQKELDALNAEWQAVTEKRKAWMDEHMPDFAEWPIGTELFYTDTGEPFGTVTKYYRYWASRDPRYDDKMRVDCEVLCWSSKNCYDNTSRLYGRSVGSREEVRGALASRL